MNAISSSNSRKEVKTIITNGKLILSSGILDNGYIIIGNGKITDIGQGQPPYNEASEVIDAKQQYVSPVLSICTPTEPEALTLWTEQ